MELQIFKLFKWILLSLVSISLVACGGQPGEEEEDIGSVLPFAVLGIQGGSDGSPDGFLTNGSSALVSWESTPLASSYSIEITDSSNTVVCAAETTTNTSFSFDSCALSEGGQYLAHVFASTAAGNSAASNSPFAFVVDTVAPESSWSSSPGAFEKLDSASFEFSGSDATSGIDSYECRLDGGSWSSCTSPFNITSLSEGSHTFEMRSLDVAGLSDGTPASYTWIVDMTEPETSIDVSPPNPDTNTTPTFEFSGTDASSGMASFECQVDGLGWVPCVSPYTLPVGLGDGAHTFEVRALDNATNEDSSPASYNWTVDNAAPDPFVITGVQGGTDSMSDAYLTNGSNAHVYWSSSTGALNYDVTIRNAADSADVCVTQNTTNTNFNFSSCGLVESATYVIKVVANDGVPLSTPATNDGFSFVVDTTAPETSIDVAPSNPDGNATPTFNFSGTDAGSGVASYECRVDGGAWGVCTSPVTTSALASGAHSFEVRALDNAGFIDASPAIHNWTVDVTNPIVSIDTAPSDPDTDTTPTFVFSGSDAHSGIDYYECRIDGGAWANCTSPHTVSPALSTGASHTFDVRAVDNVGNTSIDTHTWTVNLPATYKISGTVEDVDHGFVRLQLNGAETLDVTAGAGNFEFATELAAGEAYSVVIINNPTSPSIPCTLSNGSGTMPAGTVSNLSLDCASLQSIAVNSDKSTLIHPDSASLTAQGLYDDGIYRNLTSFVTWSSSNTGVFSITATNANSVASGTAQAQAIFVGVNASKSITVQTATLTSISLSPGSPVVFESGEVSMTATGIYDNGTSVDITEQATWTSGTPANATVSDTSGTKGLVTGVNAGTSLITATVGGVNSSTTVTVNAVTLTSIEVTPFVVSGAAGTFADLEATGLLSDGSVIDLTALATWTSNDTDTVTVVSPGRISLISAGSTTVEASYGGEMASSTINVSGATLTGITVSPATLNLPLASTIPLTAMGSYSDGSNVDITDDVLWSSDDESIVSVSNQNLYQGQVTGIATGSANVTASLSGQSDSSAVTVTSATLSSITISPPELLISKDIDVEFQAIGQYSDGSEVDITSQVVWSTSNSSLATIGTGSVSGGHLDNLYTGSSHQSFTVTASLSGINQNANVIITPADLTSVVVVPNTLSLNTGKSKNMRAFGVFDDGGSSELTDVVTWSSSDEAVLKVSNGASTTGLLQTLTEGSATVSATINGVTGNSSVTVDDIAPESESDDGIGLTGFYYTGTNFNTLVGQRIDSTIDYDWNTGTAPLGVGNSFSIRFQGQIKALYSENYTFCMRSDDGIRLRIDGVMVVENWTLHAPREDCGNITLTAGQKYDIEIEFFENGGHAVVEMRWQSASQSKVIVPSEYLYPLGF